MSWLIIGATSTIALAQGPVTRVDPGRVVVTPEMYRAWQAQQAAAGRSRPATAPVRMIAPPARGVMPVPSRSYDRTDPFYEPTLEPASGAAAAMSGPTAPTQPAVRPAPARPADPSPAPAVRLTNQEVIRSQQVSPRAGEAVPARPLLPSAGPVFRPAENPARVARQPGDSLEREPMPTEPPQPRTEEGLPPPLVPDPTSGQTASDCPDMLDLTPISELTDLIRPEGELFPENCPLDRQGHPVRLAPPVTYTWKASGLHHRPLYFEEVALERYGHTQFPLLQPAISGAKFLVGVPLMPYKIGLARPWECQYTLGYYRPGDCAPYLRYRLPLQLDGAIYQTAAIAGLIALVP